MNYKEIAFWDAAFLLLYFPLSFLLYLLFGTGSILMIALIGLFFVGILSIIIYCMHQFEEVPVLETYSVEEQSPVSDFFDNEQLLEVSNYAEEKRIKPTNPNNFGVEAEPKMRTDVNIGNVDVFDDNTDR